MTQSDFFREDQLDWYTEWVDAEVREIRGDTSTHNEIFEFDDVPL